MYAAHIGRRALAAYNEDHHPDAPLSARDFFLKVLWPIVFDDEVYLFPPGNSAIGQLVTSRRTGDSDARVEARDRLMEGFSEGVPANHLFMGGYSADLNGPTSGQITGLDITFPEEEFFCSWIGALCGVGVSGGLWLSFEERELLSMLLEGWAMYRRYIEETPGLVGNQLNTWNGWWLTHRLDQDYDAEDPYRGFSPEVRARGGRNRLDTIRWTDVIFSVASKYPARRLMVFVNTQGKMNRTYGIIPLETPEIHRMEQVWQQYFEPVHGMGWSVMRRLYQSDLGLHTACRQGVLGLSPLRPKSLERLSRRSSRTSADNSSASISLQSSLGQTWILAMLNDGSVRERAKVAAQTLANCARPRDGRAKTTNRRLVEKVLESTNRRALVEALTEVLKAVPSESQGIQALLDDLFKVSAADLPLLLALIRFEFTAINA